MKFTNAQNNTGLMYNLYQATALCATPIVAAGLLATKRGRRRYGERLGDWGRIPSVGWWMHGASVGEVQGLLPLIRKVRAQTASDRILLSATSPTGLDRGAPHVDVTRLLPLDVSFLVRRALKGVTFDRFVLSETELWPTLLRHVGNQGVPCHIVNGRVSDYTIRWYRVFSNLFGPLARRFTSVCVPDEEQRSRFMELGVASERIHVTGHTKHDISPAYGGESARREARQSLFPGIEEKTPIVALGSIRSGEEGPWFAALEKVWRSGGDCKVVVAPRHAERFGYFWDAIQKLPVSGVQWSSIESSRNRAYDVVLLNTMGQLEHAYAACDLAFVGATLVNIGGHNPLEPAMYGCPIIVGPHISVIRGIVDELTRAEGILQVSTDQEIYDILMKVCSGDGHLEQLGRRAHQVWRSHQGASERVLSIVSQSEESQ